MIFDIPVRLSGKLPAPDPKRRKFVIRVKTFGVECPNCGCQTSAATDSRRTAEGRRRRRECAQRATRFTTMETIVQDV